MQASVLADKVTDNYREQGWRGRTFKILKLTQLLKGQSEKDPSWKPYQGISDLSFNSKCHWNAVKQT